MTDRGLLSSWLTHYDPIHRGWTLEGIAHGISATNGFFCPRIRGGYNLRRLINAEAAADGVLAGAAGADAAMIHTFPWIRHEPNTTYTYLLTSMNGGGIENSTEGPTVAVSFDGSGRWTGLLPNSPADLRITPAEGGRFMVRWTYNAGDEQTAPDRFHVYHDSGTGTIDYVAVVRSVAYRRGRFHYEYLSLPFSDGQLVRWCVRAVSPDGVEEGNTRTAFSCAQAQPPPGPPAAFVQLP